MRVLIHQNAAANYVRRCYKGARPQAYGLHRPEWEVMLRAVQGTWLEVETDHLFSDQFNTAPIPGVSELGMRVMIEDVAAIEGDVRHGVLKCGWCGGYDRDDDGACDKCSKTEHLELLKVIQPILPNETATAAGVTKNT
jgi:hypothetical protein